jgi:hypothetical protein
MSFAVHVVIPSAIEARDNLVHHAENRIQQRAGME